MGKMEGSDFSPDSFSILHLSLKLKI